MLVYHHLLIALVVSESLVCRNQTAAPESANLSQFLCRLPAIPTAVDGHRGTSRLQRRSGDISSAQLVKLDHKDRHTGRTAPLVGPVCFGGGPAFQHHWMISSEPFFGTMSSESFFDLNNSSTTPAFMPRTSFSAKSDQNSPGSSSPISLRVRSTPYSP